MSIFESINLTGRVKLEEIAEALNGSILDKEFEKLDCIIEGFNETHVVIARIKRLGRHSIVWFFTDSYGNCFDLKAIEEIKIPMNIRLSEERSKQYFKTMSNSILSSLKKITENAAEKQSASDN